MRTAKQSFVKKWFESVVRLIDCSENHTISWKPNEHPANTYYIETCVRIVLKKRWSCYWRLSSPNHETGTPVRLEVPFFPLNTYFVVIIRFFFEQIKSLGKFLSFPEKFPVIMIIKKTNLVENPSNPLTRARSSIIINVRISVETSCNLVRARKNQIDAQYARNTECAWSA